MIEDQLTDKPKIRCARCGYDLRGTAIGGRCPECGAEVFDTLASNRPLSNKAVAAFTLGMLSMFGRLLYGLPGLICGYLAIAFARTAREQVQAGAVSADSLVFAKIGRTLGIIGLVLSGIFVGFIVLYLGFILFMIIASGI